MYSYMHMKIQCNLKDLTTDSLKYEVSLLMKNFSPCSFATCILLQEYLVDAFPRTKVLKSNISMPTHVRTYMLQEVSHIPCPLNVMCGILRNSAEHWNIFMHILMGSSVSACSLLCIYQVLGN